MLIDTHCHLDAPEFAADRAAVIERARLAGVQSIVVPAVGVFDFEQARVAARAVQGGAYALGIHPLYVLGAGEADLLELERQVQKSLDDPRFVAIGEIGLDFFVPELKAQAAVQHQEWMYERQLALAQRYGLPVLLHVRRSQDRVLKYLRQFPGVGGIAHAFNGSHQQADMFVRQGCALGLGGAMTFARAKQIRRLAQDMALNHLVLETDAPDLAPSWLVEPGTPLASVRSEPAQALGIARSLAQLRGLRVEQVIAATGATARRVLPRLDVLLRMSLPPAPVT
ncbi:MAG TPA: TatD family hydrolase [Alcaligenes sp.]|nr:TatD family hydrolase [Alcaligenes sp.]HRL28209.1 TatD family hydrolase [Alcaligenes sp.]